MATSVNKGYDLQTTGSNSGTWGTVLNEDVFEIIDLNLGGTQTKSLASTTPITLTTDEAKNVILRLTGTLTANITVRTPNLGMCIVENATTGAYTVSIIYWDGGSTVGTAVECPQSYAVLIVTDGTNGARRGNNAPGLVFVASGASAAEGLVPDPGSTEGTGRYLREDATFVVPPFQWTPGGRLTLTSGTPVTTGDVTAATSVYYTAMNGNTVPVYGSCASAPTQFAPVTITGGELTLTLNNPNHAANTNYDVFCFLDGSTVRIGSGPPWTSSSSRGTGAGTTQISLVSGLWTNTVAMTARNGASTYSVAAGAGTYLGTIRTGSTAGTTEDSRSNRFVFNAYNQVARNLYVTDSTNQWSYSTATWRQANGSTANQFQILIGIPGSTIDVNVQGLASASSSGFCATGVGISSTTSNSAQVYGANAFEVAVIPAQYRGYPGLGYNYIAWLEIANAGGVNFRGDAGLSYVLTGMVGTVLA